MHFWLDAEQCNVQGERDQYWKANLKWLFLLFLAVVAFLNNSLGATRDADGSRLAREDVSSSAAPQRLLLSN